MSSPLMHVLLAMTAVIGLAQLLGRLFARLGQPAVIGEMVAGILLGPSLLGRISPEAVAFVLPNEVAPQLRVVAELGVGLYMFLVGLELDPARLRRLAGAAAVVAVAGMGTPLVLGVVTALALHPHVAPPGVSSTMFAAFFAVAMSVTAFPVLARILADRGLQKSPLGVLALTCAAVSDVLAWCLLAMVVSLARARLDEGLRTLALTFGYVVLMLVLVGPVMGRLSRRAATKGELSRGSFALVFLALLCSAIATEWIGIHALFGAFLIGAIIPADGVLALRLRDKLEDLVSVVLLPVFFAFTGLRTEIGLVSGGHAWLICGLIVTVAFLGKLGGTSIAARVIGMSWRRAGALGVLMNARGLMELIVLNVGLDLGILSPALFTMMVLMAVLTTVAAGPLLQWLGRGESEPVPAPRASEVA